MTWKLVNDIRIACEANAINFGSRNEDLIIKCLKNKREIVKKIYYIKYEIVVLF